MNCKEFEKLIPVFLADGLDYPGMRRFAEHRDQCGSCREELAIQLLVTEGIQRLEDGRAFDLQKEMDKRLGRMRRSIKIRGSMIKTGIVLEAAAACILACVLMSCFIS